jgi:hypothetical protein
MEKLLMMGNVQEIRKGENTSRRKHFIGRRYKAVFALIVSVPEGLTGV